MEFYSLPNSNTVPTQRPRISRDTLRLGAICILILAIVVVGFMVLKKRPGSNVAELQIKEELAVCDTEDCATVVAARGAREQNNSSLCKLVEGDGVVECVKQYAYDKLDPSACALLSGSEEDMCFSNAQYLLASSKNDIGLCEPIIQSDIKQVCMSEMGLQYVYEGRCETTGSFRETCEQMVDEREAIAKQIGSGLCEPFLAADSELGEDGAQYVICSDVLDSVDLDGDGLVIRQEIELGTDNQNRDTDGDGFDDGTEVRGGYNPLGA